MPTADAPTPPSGATHSPSADTLGTEPAWQQVPITLSFDLGERTLTLGELKTLQVGQSLALDRPLSSAVAVRANGALIGWGELVLIDERVGVTLTALGPKPNALDGDADAAQTDADTDADTAP